jgi:hypothetical protein
MSNRLIRDFLGTFVIFGIFVLLGVAIFNWHSLSWVGVEPAQPDTGVIDSDTIAQYQKDLDSRAENALVLTGGVSILSVFAWYLIGQWGPRAQRLSTLIWKLLWWFLLMLIVITAGFGDWYWLKQGDASKYVNHVESAWMNAAGVSLVAGGLFYWVTTVCFSPLNIKYMPPLARYLRRWN